MFRRLYFLLPNAELSQKVIDELYLLGVRKRKIHAVSHEGMSMPFLPRATKEQIHDDAHLLEDILWRANLLLFFVALVVFIYSALFGILFYALISLSIMLVSFLSGDFFAMYVPHIQMNEFKHAINHNEILLMVDVPKKRIAEIEDCIHRHHPAAIEGGSSWSLQLMGL